MKKLFLYLLAAVLAVAGCTKNDPEPSPESPEEDIDGFLQEVFWAQNDDLYYEVISKQRLTPEELVESVFGPEDKLDEEELAIKEAFLKRCDEKLEELRKEDPDGAAAIYFDRTFFKYHTVDQNGNRIELSAFVGWAIHRFPWWPYDQNHVLLCCPYTHTKEDECATESNNGFGGGYEFLTMLHDNLFIMPDGQGFGTNKDKVQTYLNHNLHAQQYYDALKVGQKIYLDEHGKLEDDWTLRVVGASQGGGDAIALHKYLDTHYDKIDLTECYESKDPFQRIKANQLCKLYGYPQGTKIIEAPFRDIHRFEFSYVCCGPYSPEVTMQTYSKWGQMSYPCVIPLVIKSMLACYPNELKKYREEDFFSGKWNSNKADFDNIYLKKTMKSDDLNEYICEKLGIKMKDHIPMAPLDSILSKSMLDTTSQIYKDLMTCLKKQDLTRGWTPRTKTKLHFTSNDEVVPYANTQKLIELFKASNCTYKTVDRSWAPSQSKVPVGHVGCCSDYIQSSWDW